MLDKLQKLVKKAMNWNRPCSYIVYVMVMVMAIAVAIPIGIALFCSSCFGYTMGNLGSLGDFLVALARYWLYSLHIAFLSPNNDCLIRLDLIRTFLRCLGH